MPVGYPTPLSNQYTVEIITVDVSQRLVEIKIQNNDLRRIIVQHTPLAFRWPIVGEVWLVEQVAGDWHLLEPAQATVAPDIDAIEPGDALINSPTGRLWIAGSEDGATDFMMTKDAFQRATNENDAQVYTRAEFDNAGGGALPTLGSVAAVVPLDVVTYDVGASWDLAGHRFIAPYTGIYEIIWQIAGSSSPGSGFANFGSGVQIAPAGTSVYTWLTRVDQTVPIDSTTVAALGGVDSAALGAGDALQLAGVWTNFVPPLVLQAPPLAFNRLGVRLIAVTG